MAFKLKSSNTTTFKMMGSSFKDTGDHEHPHGKKTQEGVTRTDEETAQLIAEKKERDKVKEMEQSINHQGGARATVADAASNYSNEVNELPGVYSNAEAKTLMEQGMENLTDAQRKKLAYSSGTSAGGQMRIGNRKLGLSINQVLEDYEAGRRREKPANKVEEKKASEKVTEWYFTPDGKARSKTGYPDPKTGKLPAYEHQGVTTNPLIGTNK